MTDLVRQMNLGDISFGAPQDIPILHTPWGYYKFLGVSTDASEEDIKKAYKQRSRELHPDIGGSVEDMRALNHVVDVLLDDGGELGREHSRRTHYNQVCSMDFHFDEYIQCKGDRTKKFSEIMLINLEIERKKAEIEQKATKKNPEFKKLKKKLNSDISREKKIEIAKKLQDMVDEVLGMTPENKEEFIQARKAREVEYERKQRKFVSKISSSQRSYYRKILDIFHVRGGKVVFGTEEDFTGMCILHHDNRKKVLELVIAEDAYIAGFPKVHFKSGQAELQLEDPNVSGVFHLISGNVNLDYETSTYGGVIRARSKQTLNLGGFVQRGDLFVPEKFALGEWWNKKPVVDISVKEGPVTLRLSSPALAYSPIFEKDKYSLNNIIEKEYSSKINKYFY